MHRPLVFALAALLALEQRLGALRVARRGLSGRR
jgi:hypothetical protein